MIDVQQKSLQVAECSAVYNNGQALVEKCLQDIATQFAKYDITKRAIDNDECICQIKKLVHDIRLANNNADAAHDILFAHCSEALQELDAINK